MRARGGRVFVWYTFGGVVFEWDELKAIANLRKHGVSFEEAATVFADPLAAVHDDPDSDEVRLILFGKSAEERELLVVHVERGERLRIISARRATRQERRRYADSD